jgi:predicted metal-dependent enzyme (double-stranded beta helix superfamily)
VQEDVVTTRVRYSVEDFVRDMQTVIDDQGDQQRLFDRGSVYLERLLREPDAVPEEYRRPVGRGRRANHGSYVLHRGPGLFVTSVVWGPGEHVGPHDHHTWGMIGVMGNGIQEQRFRRVDDRRSDEFARLERDRTMLVRPGEVSLLIPEVDEIHQLDNFSDRPTVEVHVYGEDLVGLNRCQYDLETGRITRLVSGKFNNC